MARGRPPKPTTLHWLNGDPGKRKRYQTEPEAPAGIPECPPELDPIAKEEWSRVVKALADMGILSTADRTIITLYVESWSRYRTAADQVAKYGSVILSKNKSTPLISPYHSVMRAALADVHRFGIELGLSPAARARMRVEAKPDSGQGRWLGLVS